MTGAELCRGPVRLAALTALVAVCGCAFLPQPAQRHLREGMTGPETGSVGAAEPIERAPRAPEPPPEIGRPVADPPGTPVKEPPPPTPTPTPPAPVVNEPPPEPSTPLDDPLHAIANLSVRAQLLGLQCSQEKIFFSGGTSELTWPEGFRTQADAQSGPLVPILQWQCKLLRRDLTALRARSGAAPSVRDGIERVQRQLDYLSTRYGLEPGRDGP